MRSQVSIISSKDLTFPKVNRLHKTPARSREMSRVILPVSTTNLRCSSQLGPSTSKKIKSRNLQVTQQFSLRQKALSPLPDTNKPRVLQIARGHLNQLLDDHQTNHQSPPNIYSSSAQFSLPESPDHSMHGRNSMVAFDTAPRERVSRLLLAQNS